MIKLILIIVFGVIGGIIFQKLDIPGGAVVGSMLFSAIAAIVLKNDFVMPKYLSTTIQIILGISLGFSFNRNILELAPKVVLIGVVSTTILLTVAICLALLFSKLKILDFGTALFGFSPGGMSGMSILAQTEGFKTQIVAFLHTIRIFFLFLIVPILARLLK